MVRAVIPSAFAASATFHGAPHSPASHNNSARAWINFAAVDFPLRVNSVSCARSAFVSVTLYRLAMREHSRVHCFFQYEIACVT